MTPMSRAGFTLLETLVALALLALVMGAASQMVRPPSDKLRIEAAARALCSALRATHARAMATNSETRLVLDVARKTFVSPVGGEAALPSDAAVRIEAAQGQRQGSDAAGVTFFPDGTSSGGDITIELPSGRASIGVNWLTGETACGVA